MTSTLCRVLALGLVAALLGLGTPYAAAPAHAAESTVAVTYTCVLSGGGGEQEAHLELSLDQLPDSVAPGASVDLAGSLAITFPDLTALQSQLTLASKVSLSGSSLGIEVRSGDAARVIAPRDFTGAETGFAKPFTLTASFTLPGVAVPADASEIVLRLPNEPSVPNTAGATPANVALTLEIAQNGLQTSRSAGCWTPDNKPVVLARVPVRAAASDSGTPAPAAPTASAAAVPGLPVAPPPAAGAPAAPPPPVAAEAAAPPVDPAATAPGAVPAAATTPVFYAPIPEPTRSDIFLPTWLLVLGALAVVTAAVLYGLILRRRAHAVPERTS